MLYLQKQLTEQYIATTVPATSSAHICAQAIY